MGLFRVMLQPYLAFQSTTSVRSSHFQIQRGPLLIPPSTQMRFFHGRRSSLPDLVDWRCKRAVTSVKDQGRLGVCWAFAAAAAVEALHYIHTRKLISLSVQELCDIEPHHSREKGGSGEAREAFAYILKYGISYEKDYPYVMKYGRRKGRKPQIMKHRKVFIDGYRNVAPNEYALMKAVVKQPVVVSVDPRCFNVYEGGVSERDPRHYGKKLCLNHQMLCVGYGSTKRGLKYWILKNSWGRHWGIKGYMRMERGVGMKGGLCGIALDALYPVLDPRHK